jgi:hypothetical protein
MYLGTQSVTEGTLASNVFWNTIGNTMNTGITVFWNTISSRRTAALAVYITCIFHPQCETIRMTHARTFLE